MNLPTFPVAKPGETFTSVVARALARSAALRGPYLKSLGLRYLARPNSGISRNLGRVASLMPSGHPWKDAPELIVKGHTLVPLWLHFAHSERVVDTLNNIIEGRTENPAASLGTSIGKPTDAHFSGRFCPDCVARDIKTLGFSVLYRQHQPLFVNMCALHARLLHFNCLLCHKNTSAAAGLWQMAGRCDCRRPHTPAVLSSDLDAKTEGFWLWLSQQVATILAQPTPLAGESVAANLAEALKKGGFEARNGGLNLKAIREALLDRFEESLLHRLGFSGWCDPHGQSPNQVLKMNMVGSRAIPSVLRMLLFTHLVTNDVASLWKSAAADSTKLTKVRVPAGYGGNKRKNRKYVGKAAILSTLAAVNGKFTVAAERLGVRYSSLAVEMLQNNISLPLSAMATKRLGFDRIAAVREALAQGVTKNEIQQRFDISSYSLLLIELDQPKLTKAHREATIFQQREKHRNAFLAFMRDTAKPSRRLFTIQHGGSYHWLSDCDRDWFAAQLPKKRPYARREKPQKLAKNWSQLDQVAVSNMRIVVQQELSKPDRPTRLSLWRLFSPHMNWGNRHRFPITIAEAARYVETSEQFMRRVICWALHEYAKQHAFISMNLLRRVAQLPWSKLMEHRDYVCELAAELELSFHPRCALAPWNDGVNDS